MTKRVETDYDLRVISYLDVMGFRHLVDASSAAHVKQLLQQFRRRSDPDDVVPGSAKALGLRFTNFSDTTIRSVSISGGTNRTQPTGELYHEIVDLTHVQHILLRQGILTRGCITVGQAIHEDDLVFGPGIVRAYELESEFVRFPRIILDKLALRLLRDQGVGWLLKKADHSTKEELDHIRAFASWAEEGHMFLDYLRSMDHEFDDTADYVEFIADHQRLVINGLKIHAAEKRIRSKYVWLRRYHNRTIRALGTHYFRALGLKLSSFLV